MPLYEYACEVCGHQFEKIQKFSDPLVSSCPECEGKVNKLVSSPAIQFKGTGWYITDYARKPSGGQAESSGDGPSEKEKKGSGGQSDSSSSSSSNDGSASKDRSSSSTPSKTETKSSSPQAPK
jgi:putative FmdB family regulatory protein